MKLACVLMAFVALACAAVSDDVRAALSAGDLKLAEAIAARDQTAYGQSVDLAFAHSWIARAFLERKDYSTARDRAEKTEKECRALLKTRALDRDPQLALALGAAVEVESQSLAAEGARDQAVMHLRAELNEFRNTSIRARIQKNLNLLTLEGHAAPPLETAQALSGPRPVSLAAMRGHPVLLFFWAHWCSDCKAEIDIIAHLLTNYGSRGFVVIGPTQHYGYVAGGAEAPRPVETRYMESVRKEYFSKIARMAVPVSEENFRNYGVSTTPTLVLIDKAGIVRLYHPGGMDYADLEQKLRPLL